MKTAEEWYHTEGGPSLANLVTCAESDFDPHTITEYIRAVQVDALESARTEVRKRANDMTMALSDAVNTARVAYEDAANATPPPVGSRLLFLHAALLEARHKQQMVSLITGLLLNAI